MSRLATRRTIALAGLCTTALGVNATSASAATDPVGPQQSSLYPTLAYGMAHPTALPPGMNDWSCRPSAAHPRPVVLILGTFANRYNSFAALSPALKAQGYCVYGANIGAGGAISALPGFYATGPTEATARELASFVDSVRSSTHAAQVDLVGWSQGGIIARGYLKFFGGADASNPVANKVKNVVTYGATNHGTTFNGLLTLGHALKADPVLSAAAPAVVDQEVDSAYLHKLNAGSETFPGVHYTVIGTAVDQVTTPYQSTFLKAGPGATVNNVTLQSGCRIDLSDHLQLPYSPRVIGLTLKALGSNVTVPCVPRTALG